MRISVLIAALAVAAPLGLCAGSASAQLFEDQSVLFGRRHGYVYEGAWCARENIGGSIQEECTFDSFERCRQAVIQGNRGFCTQNPAFVAGYGGEPQRKKKRRVEHQRISHMTCVNLHRHARACRGHPRLGTKGRRGWPGHGRA
jgi:hypothetical protein